MNDAPTDKFPSLVFTMCLASKTAKWGILYRECTGLFGNVPRKGFINFICSDYQTPQRPSVTSTQQKRSCETTHFEQLWPFLTRLLRGTTNRNHAMLQARRATLLRHQKPKDSMHKLHTRHGIPLQIILLYMQAEGWRD